MHEHEWQELALCVDNPGPFEEDTEYLFEGSYKQPPIYTRYPRFEEAVAICAECPVMAQCLRAGVNEKSGIWGGRIVGT